MPLRALIDGEDVLAPLLGDPDWEALRRDARSGVRVPVLPCCQNRAYQRTSARGCKHFYHPPQASCDHRGETETHLLAKYSILRACLDSGYGARTEWAEGDWRADVLAVKEDVRIAFEVELVRPPLHELLKRQTTYQRAGVRACWFCPNPPAPLQLPGIDVGLKARKDLPLFELVGNPATGFAVTLYGQRYPLETFVAVLLDGKIVHREKATVRRESAICVGFFKTQCWKCAAEVDVYRVGSEPPQAVTTCGVGVRLSTPPQADTIDLTRPEFLPEVRAAVRKYVQSDAGRDLHLAIMRRRKGHVPGFRSAVCFGCPRCGAPFVYTKLSRRPDRMVTLQLGGAPRVDLEWPHWCFGRDGSFCPE